MRLTTENSLRETRRAWRAFSILAHVTETRVLDRLETRASRPLEAIAAETGLDARALRVSLDLLVANGLLVFDGGYRLADSAPAVLACFAELEHEWRDLAAFGDVLRTGQPLHVTRGGVDTHDDEARARFLAALCRRAQPSVPEAVRLVGAAIEKRADRTRRPAILDFGGGHGLFAAAFARAFPDARVLLFDQPEAIPHARALNGEGFAAVGGDYLVDPLQTDFDVVFLSNIVHGESADRAAEIVRRAAKALVPGGYVVVRDRIVNDDRTGPDYAVDFAVTLVMWTEQGMTRTRGELMALLCGAGLELVDMHAVPVEEYAYAVARRPGEGAS